MVRETINDPQHPEGLTPFQEQLVQNIYNYGMVRFGEFKLNLHDDYPEAPLSPIYINLRLFRRYPEAMVSAVNAYKELLAPLEYDLLADVPDAATPIVAAISWDSSIGMVTPQKKKKIHGLVDKKVIGMVPGDEDKRAVLIDDLITSGTSTVEAAGILKANNLVVEDVVVLIDREQGGKENLSKHGLTLHYAFTMQQMLDYYLRVGSIDQVKYDQVQEALSRLRDFQGIS